MAAPRAYSGAWRDQTRYVDRALAPAPGVDPSHSRVDAPDEGSRPPSGAPRMDLPPMYATEQSDAAYAFAVDTPGLVLDMEPEGHNTTDLSGPVPNVAHRIDRGGSMRQSHEERFLRAHDERPETTRVETTPDRMGDPTVATLRGDNSLPQNNPDGYRYGWLVWRRNNRRMFQMGPEVRHTLRLLRPNTAAAPADSPVPMNPGRYASPYGTLSQFIQSRLQSPILRRNPPEVSETVTDDGTATGDDQFMDWVTA
jgi:hypothetical protein